MPQNDDFDIDDDEMDDPSAAMKQMRKRIRDLEKENKESAAARRELAFVKAGVDTESKVGKLFLRTFDGDLSDIDGIKVEAEDLGCVKAAAAVTADATPEVPVDLEAESSTAERQSLASGALPDDGKGVNVKASALATAEEAVNKGARWEVATGGYLNALANAAANGDQSVMVQ
jgi:hypothetical protein